MEIVFFGGNSKKRLFKMGLPVALDSRRIGSWEGAHWNHQLEFYAYADIWIFWRVFKFLAGIQSGLHFFQLKKVPGIFSG